MDLFAPRHILIIVLLCFLAGIYFLPTIIAFAREHRNKVPILLVNLFLGWTVLGWLAALIWSVTSQKPQVIVVNNTAGPQPPI
jgi:Superinfection immunity protein